MKVFEAKERKGRYLREMPPCLLKALGSSAAAGRGSEGRRGGGGQSGSTQRYHKMSLIVLRSGQRVSDKPTIRPSGLDRLVRPHRYCIVNQ